MFWTPLPANYQTPTTSTSLLPTLSNPTVPRYLATSLLIPVIEYVALLILPDVVSNMVKHVGTHAVLQILTCMVNVEKRMRDVGGDDIYNWIEARRSFTILPNFVRKRISSQIYWTCWKNGPLNALTTYIKSWLKLSRRKTASMSGTLYCMCFFFVSSG